MKELHLIYIIVGGIIIADLVAHVAGTNALFGGLHTMFSIFTKPTDTSAIHTTSTSVTNNGSAGTAKA